LINKLYSYFIQEMVEEVVLQQAVEETARVVETPVRLRGVRRARGRRHQMLERPGPAGLIPRVADNLNAFGNNY